MLSNNNQIMTGLKKKQVLALYRLAQFLFVHVFCFKGGGYSRCISKTIQVQKFNSSKSGRGCSRDGY